MIEIIVNHNIPETMSINALLEYFNIYGLSIEHSHINEVYTLDNKTTIKLNKLKDEISSIEPSILEEEEFTTTTNTNKQLLAYISDLRDFIISENFYDDKGFSNYFNNKYFINKDDYSEITSFNINKTFLNNRNNNILEKLHENISYLQQKIKEKYDYFKKEYYSFKKGIFNDLGVIIKRIEEMKEDNTKNANLIDSLNYKFNEYIEKYNVMTKKQNEVEGNYESVKAEMNKFYLDLIYKNIIKENNLSLESKDNNLYYLILRNNLDLIFSTITNNKTNCYGCIFCSNKEKNSSINYDMNMYQV